MNEHIKSALITFFVGFALVVLPDIDTITLTSLADGTVAGLLFAAVRGGVKALLELFLMTFSK